MHFAVVASIAALVSVARAATFNVMVGQDSALTFSPESVNANVGDTIAFRFLSKNHSVTQSTFAKPCERMVSPTLGVDSGFVAVPAGATSFPEWSFTIENASAPFWFFCAQVPHCSKGMVFAVNPTAEKSFETFKAVAMGGSASSTQTTDGATASQTSESGALSIRFDVAAVLTALSLLGTLLL